MKLAESVLNMFEATAPKVTFKDVIKDPLFKKSKKMLMMKDHEDAAKKYSKLGSASRVNKNSFVSNAKQAEDEKDGAGFKDNMAQARSEAILELLYGAISQFHMEKMPNHTNARDRFSDLGKIVTEFEKMVK